MPHIQITITPISKNISDILIAILSEQNFDGFEEQENTLQAFIPKIIWDEQSFENTIQPFALQYTIQQIEPRNWNAEWESSYEPIIINNQVAIRATFHQAITTSAHNILIVPKMSFGTGHHATTFMMMEWICETDCTNKSVLDYGCGTGVLAIYAAYKNAKNILAIDIDAWSVENTIENIDLNQAKNINVVQGDLEKTQETFDLILANINLHILLKNKANLYKILNTNGLIFLSGILCTDAKNLIQQFENEGFIFINEKQNGIWASIKMIKNL